MKGKRHSWETRQKMSLAQLGKKVSEEVGKKISEAKKGKNIGGEHDNSPIPVLHIPTNTIYRSITQAANYFKLRRGTLSKRISNGEETNFKFL